ncbi:MAG: glycerol kinase [Candidatus Sedimenticola sp. (ex Thyasira tokunagai)]
MDSIKYISTTKLSKQLAIPTKHLFGRLVDLGYVKRENDTWVLLQVGINAGGKYQESKKLGKYIVWPESIKLEKATAQGMLSATNLGGKFDLSARRINQILSEHGWIKKHLKGWLVTPLGQSVGGEQREDNKSGIPFVLWPSTVVENVSLKNTIKELKGDSKEAKEFPVDAPSANKASGFRDKFKPKLRTADGHFVRSRAEMLIDNWLYTSEIVHAYERRLPIEEEVYCDFYLPIGKVYIEFWGMESDPKYLARKNEKVAIYQQYGFSLIELNDKDISNLDDVLPRMLLKHGITTY